jgi:uncharacterized protein (DUF1330 family)
MIEPDQGQLAQLTELVAERPDSPVVMLNLNKYRDRSEYERYGEVAVKVLARVGGEILWYSQAVQTVIGDDHDQYDEVIAVRYPSAAAFVAFANDPEIAAALVHRAAALERAALICCEPGAGVLA